MPRSLEDVLAYRDSTSLKMRAIMYNIQELLKRNSHMCYTAKELYVAVDYPSQALPILFVLHKMVTEAEWHIESPVKGWFRWSER